MLQQQKPDDFVIATGESNSLEDFVATAFSCVDLDWHDHVVIDPELKRPTDLNVGKGNPAKARKQLGWEAQYKMKDVIRMMLHDEQERG